MVLWKLHDLKSCHSDSWCVVRKQLEEDTNEPIYVFYRRRQVQGLADALTLAALIFGASILAGFGLAMGWAWARGGF